VLWARWLRLDDNTTVDRRGKASNAVMATTHKASFRGLSMALPNYAKRRNHSVSTLTKRMRHGRHWCTYTHTNLDSDASLHAIPEHGKGTRGILHAGQHVAHDSLRPRVSDGLWNTSHTITLLAIQQWQVSISEISMLGFGWNTSLWRITCISVIIIIIKKKGNVVPVLNLIKHYAMKAYGGVNV
jgi:hypothetical protein